MQQSGSISAHDSSLSTVFWRKYLLRKGVSRVGALVQILFVVLMQVANIFVAFVIQWFHSRWCIQLRVAWWKSILVSNNSHKPMWKYAVWTHQIGHLSAVLWSSIPNTQTRNFRSPSILMRRLYRTIPTVCSSVTGCRELERLKIQS